ncbi:MAG TPA: poly(3-hydroxybutyrate) depolymerase [Pseudomonadales bacterium]
MLKNLKYQWPLYAAYIMIFSLVLVLPLSAYLFYRSHMYTSEFLQAAAFSYPAALNSACTSGDKSGSAGVFKEKTVKGISFTVKTPSNYQSAYAHPLLIVFAPSGVPGSLVEKFTGLTRRATEAGFIIVYADSRAMSIESMLELGTIAKQVASKWCINSEKVFLTGHSDGGTISSALTFLPESPLRAAAIAPSAAGVRAKDLAAYACPAPVSVMVMHGKKDGHFPGFGQEAAQWWAECNQCQTKQPITSSAECVVYTACLESVEVRYCEGKGGHLDWPHLNDELIEFFQGVNKG